MSFSAIAIIILAIASILAGVLLLKKSAKKFDLTPEQLEEIKKRNKAIDKQEESEREH